MNVTLAGYFNFHVHHPYQIQGHGSELLCRGPRLALGIQATLHRSNKQQFSPQIERLFQTFCASGMSSLYPPVD